VGGHGILYTHCLKNWETRRLPCPPPNYAHGYTMLLIYSSQ